MPMTSFAAENAGIAVEVSPQPVQAGELVTVTVSLTDYNSEAIPIRGMQIDVTGVDESILTVEDGGYKSLIEDNTAVANIAVYHPDYQRLRLLYARMEGTLVQPQKEVFQMTFRINSEVMEEGSITLPLKAMIQTTEAEVTLNDEIKLSYVPAGETPDPDVVSVNIEWGGMNYTYTEGTWNPATHEYDNEGWDDNNSGYVTVINEGTVDTTATFIFNQKKKENSGSFTDDTNAVIESVNIPKDQFKKVYLHLYGKPAQKLNAETIGSVTVKIGGE